MGIIKAMPFILAGCLVGGVAWAKDVCPTSPFETDVRVIAAAIASHPLRPRVWDASRNNDRSAAEMADGASWYAAGGLMNYGSVELIYDANRYVVIHIQGQWPPRGMRHGPNFGRQLSNQVVRSSGNATYTTTITRPTPEQARRFACLTNLLADPALKRVPSALTGPAIRPPLPQRAVGGENSETCSSRGQTSYEGTDAAFGNFGLVSGGSVLEYNPQLSCAAREDLVYQMAALANDWVIEAIARADGTWQAPHVRSIATDGADNKYLLLDPGTIIHRTFDILKVAPSGDVRRMPGPADFIRRYADTLAVDRQGHVWVPTATPGSGEPVFIYDMAPEGGASFIGRTNKSGIPEPLPIDTPIDSIAADTNDHLFALSGIEILKISPKGTGTVMPFASLPRRTKAWWSSLKSSHIAAAPDGSLFVSDSTSNIILKVSQDKVVTTLAGTSGKRGASDGPRHRALFNSPMGLALGPEGTLYVADSGNQTIRRITPDGQVSTFVGSPGRRGTVDGQGEKVRLDRPAAIAIDSTGTLYATNGEDNRIRKISPTGVVSTVNAQPFIDAEEPEPPPVWEK
jgi:sugar lactone lactonase YvrE